MQTDASEGFRTEVDAHPAKRRLLVISNRGPIEHFVDDDGQLCRRPSGGGVATALTRIARHNSMTWIASAVSAADRAVAAEGCPLDLGEGSRLRLVAPPLEAYDLFYNTFCNPLLWFLQHSLWDRLQRRNAQEQALDAWENGYLPVNQAFAEAAASELGSGRDCAGVMLHDYHLYLAPLLIRNLCPTVPLQHFIHIPWPHLEAWQQLPRRMVDSICEGLLANDSVVFQTESSVQSFLLTCWAFLPGAKVDFNEETVTYRGRRTRISANPISVDPFDLWAQVTSPDAGPYYEKLADEIGERTIVRVDRLDPSKNVDTGLRAFDLLLRRHPEWAGHVKLLSFLAPSRTNIQGYRAYAKRVFALVEDINARHGKAGWTPIKVFYEHNRLQALVAMTLYDVLLVNSLADGMNLVSKEGPILNQRDGVMVLSVGAGSFEELQDGAFAVHPDDIEGTARALHAALSLPETERRERAFRLRQAVLQHDLASWLRLQLQDLARVNVAESLLVGGRSSSPYAYLDG